MDKLTDQYIDEIIVSETYHKIGSKTTVCLLTLKNGFEVIESSSCVCALNYDHGLGKKFSRERAVQKVWELEGYLLQQAQHEATEENFNVDAL